MTLTVVCVIMVYLVGDGQLPARPTRGYCSSEHPDAGARATILQYRSVSTGVLPTFVRFHLLLAPLLLLLLKMPNLALGASFLLYGLVQFTAAMASNEWYSNPFAWQYPVVWSRGGKRPTVISCRPG